MKAHTTAAYRDGLHRRDNRYRWNEARGCWEFDDGVGPWTPSAMLRGATREAGAAALASMGYDT